MREVNSTLVHYQIDNNIESKHNIKATSLLPCNDELSEYKHKYNVRKILEEEMISINAQQMIRTTLRLKI